MNQDSFSAMIVDQTREWIQKAVIGLNLCPFTKPVYTQNLIRYHVTEALSEEQLLLALQSELQLMLNTPISQIETTLLIHPHVLNDFLEYNDFLGLVEEALIEMGLDGVIQVASFHPRFQFAGTVPDDISNYTNRSPYPILHLLREESMTRAVDSSIDVDAIPDQNILTLERLGLPGWKNLRIPAGS